MTEALKYRNHTHDQLVAIILAQEFNHDTTIGEMLDPEDEAEIGLLGRDASLQFVKLCAAFNQQKAEIAALTRSIAFQAAGAS
jgi:hypothetical protein